MIAYFDTQAFDHIYKKIGCTSADIANLRKAIYGRRLSIRLSIHTLEEILLGRKVSPQAFAAQIKLTLSLASSRSLVKACGRLVLDDVRAYATGVESDRPFLPWNTQNAVADGISALIESDGEEVEDDFLAVLEQARQEKMQFLAMLEDLKELAKTISGPADGWANFQQYFDAAAIRVAAGIAERAGVLDSCRARGLRDLLDVKSVRMSVFAGLALGFDQSAIAASSSVAVSHAVSAAVVAQTYVTESAATREFVASLPGEALHVAGLPEFLKSL
jgi:hypothetical protein